MTSFYTNVARMGNSILVRGWHNGSKYFNREKFKPTRYIQSPKPSKFKSLDGRDLEPIEFDSISDCRAFHERYKGTTNFEVFGMDNHVIEYISKEFPSKIDYDVKQLDIMSLDIETECEYGFPNIELANERINAITMFINDQYITVGLGDYIPHLPNVRYKRFHDEVEMLKAFVMIWEGLKPDIVTGWNIINFDIPYLVRRIRRLLDESWVKRLSPWGIINESTWTGKYGKENVDFDLVGINVIDLLDTYQKYSGKRPENFKLDTVAYYELGQKKTDYSEYGSLRGLYQNNFQKFIEYNIKDTELVLAINDKTQLIALIMNLAYDAKVNPIDAFKATRIWDSKCYNHLFQKNVIVPYMRSEDSKTEAFDGAYVQDPIPGMYDNVLHFDVKSEYPSMIMQYNISPETFVGQVNLNLDNLIKGIPHGYEAMLKEKNLSMAANGTLYRRDVRGFLSEMIEEMMADRDKYKASMQAIEKQLNDMATAGVNDPQLKTKLEAERTKYDILQQTKKVNLNSLYGAVGAVGFRFFKVVQAEAITTSGQLTIRWAQHRLNELINKMAGTQDIEYVIYIDTDSIALHIDVIVSKVLSPDTDLPKIIEFMHQFGMKKIAPFLTDAFNQLKEFMNAYDQKVFMQMEKISRRTIYTSKKHYILSIYEKDKIRFKEPKLDVKGLESVRSSTPEAVREYLKKAFKIIVETDRETTLKYISDARDKFYKLPPEEIAFPKGVSEVTKYVDVNQIYKKGTPINSRASILYNHYVKAHGLQNKYEYIKDDDKIKYLYLKMPNPIHENIIAFTTILPPEFDLHEYVDYGLQFEKTFMSPLNTIFNAIKWSLDANSATLDDFFS